MSNIKIVLDSSADVTLLDGVDFAYAPLKINTAERKFVDDNELAVDDMVEYLYTYKGKSSTSCPNTEDWLTAFGDAEEIFCITITSNLSGSYNSARVAKEEYEAKYPERRVELIDSLSAGPEIALMAERIRDLICEGKSFDEITELIRGYKTGLLFVLESMKNLANNGRVSKLAATVAGFLGIRAVGKASDIGTLEMLTKCRGTPKAIEAMVGYMTDMGYRGGKVKISHCLNEDMALKLKESILAEFPYADVEIGECRGLCSFYAERGGMLMGFET